MKYKHLLPPTIINHGCQCDRKLKTTNPKFDIIELGLDCRHNILDQFNWKSAF